MENKKIVFSPKGRRNSYHRRPEEDIFIVGQRRAFPSNTNRTSSPQRPNEGLFIKDQKASSQKTHRQPEGRLTEYYKISWQKNHTRPEEGIFIQGHDNAVL